MITHCKDWYGEEGGSYVPLVTSPVLSLVEAVQMLKTLGPHWPRSHVREGERDELRELQGTNYASMIYAVKSKCESICYIQNHQRHH